jgi:hypothetical protein
MLTHPRNIVPWKREATKSETNAANRCVNELYAMMNGYVVSCASEGRLKLEQAAGIAGYDHVRIYAGDMSCFAVTEFSGSFGLDKVIDAGGTAADGCFRDLQDFKIRDSAQHGARL